MAVAWKKLAYEDDTVLKAMFDAYSVLMADADNTPTALTVGPSTIVGRKAAGGIVALTKAELLAILNVADGANNYVHPNHSGDVTSVADGAQTIAAGAVTLAKMADLAQNTIIGRVTASTGVPEALSATNVRTIINVADGATANTKASGAEVDTGTDDAKFLTAKAINDSHNVPMVAPGTNGNILTSNGTDWTSSAPGAPAAHALSAHTAATANLSLAGYQINDQVIQTVANVAAVNAYATPVVGKVLFSTAETSLYLCTSAA